MDLLHRGLSSLTPPIQREWQASRRDAFWWTGGWAWKIWLIGFDVVLTCAAVLWLVARYQ